MLEWHILNYTSCLAHKKFDKVIEIESDDSDAWYCKGAALKKLDRK